MTSTAVCPPFVAQGRIGSTLQQGSIEMRSYNPFNTPGGMATA